MAKQPLANSKAIRTIIPVLGTAGIPVADPVGPETGVGGHASVSGSYVIRTDPPPPLFPANEPLEAVV